MGHWYGRIRAYLVENRLLVAGWIASALLSAVYVRQLHPDPHLENALDATIVVNEDTVGDIGSGFFFTPDGCAMTADHVVSDAMESKHKIFVKRRGVIGQVEATVVARDWYVDAAVICIKAPSPAYLEIADSEGLLQGDPVYAIGHPGMRKWNVTQGIISRMGYKVHNFDGSMIPRFDVYTSAFISYGNSGGPLIDRWGRVIGMVTNWDDPMVGVPNNLNIAVPGTDLRRMLRSAWGRL